MSLPLDVRELVEQPGSSRKVALAEPVEGLATGLVEVPVETPVRLELLLESLVEGILVTGRVAGEAAHRCARCLKEFDGPFDVRLSELFAAGSGPDDDEYPLQDGTIDLEPMIRDAVLLSLPFSPLCRADCKGLCERCGGDRNLGECSCGPVTDARWDVLNEIKLEG